jgi:outer membrane protein
MKTMVAVNEKSPRLAQAGAGARRRARSIILPALALFLLIGSGALQAQQITRVAVIDLARVLSAFPKDVAALKNFETKKAEVQAEVDRRSAEIKALQAKKADAQASGNGDGGNSYDAEIQRKINDLKDYATARQNELDLLAKALSSGASFLQKLNTTIAQVAEAEGYSLVLNLKPQDQNANIVLWNSASIDLTDKVIQALSAAH